MKSPKAPKPTAEQVATERRQTMLLDKTIAEEEERFKQLARGKLGKSSLLAGAAGTRTTAAKGGVTGRGAGMLGGGGAGSSAATGTGFYGGTSRTTSGPMAKR